MARRSTATVLGLAAASVIAVGPAIAQSVPSVAAQEAAVISADKVSHYQERAMVVASGNVEVAYGPRVLMADTLAYNRKLDQMVATGNVRFLQENGDVLFAEYMELSGDFEDGSARGLLLLFADNARAGAATARRINGRHTTLYNAVYSPCEPCRDNPDAPLTWQLRAKEINHDDQQRRLEYKDVTLEFMGVPVLYTPYLTHADPRKTRESGFLMPSYGNSSDLGAFARLPYYFNISPSRDLTVEPTLYFGEMQPLMSARYRAHTTNGFYEMGGSATYIDEDNPVGGTRPNNSQTRWHARGEGAFDIDDTWRWGYDLDRASDTTYLRRYGFGADETLTSRLYTEGFRGRNYAEASFYSFQEIRNPHDAKRVPDSSLRLAHNFVGTPGPYGAYWTLDSSVMAVTRDIGHETRRLSSKAGWHLPYTSPAGGVYNLSAVLQGDAYHVNDLVNPDGDRTRDGFAARVFPQVGFEWRHPLVRTHGTVSEVLEPAVGIYAAPNAGNTWKIPNEDSHALQFNDASLFNMNRFPGLDRVEGGTRMDYGLRWAAYGASGGSTRVFVGQSVRLKDDDTFPVNSGLEENFSDIVGRVRVAPNRFVDLTTRFRNDPNSLALLQNETSLAIGPQAVRFNVEYTFIDAEADVGDFGDRNEIAAGLNAQLSRTWSTTLAATHRLSNPEGLLEAGLGIQYEDDCFLFGVEASRSYFSDGDLRPEDRIVMRIFLKSIGELASPSVSLSEE